MVKTEQENICERSPKTNPKVNPGNTFIFKPPHKIRAIVISQHGLNNMGIPPFSVGLFAAERRGLGGCQLEKSEHKNICPSPKKDPKTKPTATFKKTNTCRKQSKSPALMAPFSTVDRPTKSQIEMNSQTRLTSSIVVSHRQKTSATMPNIAMRQQRKSFFLAVEPLPKNRLFFWYFSFGEAKEKYDHAGR